MIPASRKGRGRRAVLRRPVPYHPRRSPRSSPRKARESCYGSRPAHHGRTQIWEAIQAGGRTLQGRCHDLGIATLFNRAPVACRRPGSGCRRESRHEHRHDREKLQQPAHWGPCRRPWHGLRCSIQPPVNFSVTVQRLAAVRSAPGRVRPRLANTHEGYPPRKYDRRGGLDVPLPGRATQGARACAPTPAGDRVKRSQPSLYGC